MAPEKNMPEISVIVPVYRSATTLAELCQKLIDTVENISPDFEILLVEDCGGDDSWQVIESLAKGDKRIRGYKLSRNFGQHAATICGIGKSSGRWVVTLDDDLEQGPEDIERLYQRAQEGYSLVYGIYPERSHAGWRNLTSGLARKMFTLAIPSLNHAYTSFRLIDGRLARELCQFDSPFPFIDGYLSWLTNNYSTVEVQHSSRAVGHSNYTFRKLFTHTINIFVTFSDLPLKLASWLGLTCSLLGMVWLLVILLGKLLGGITVSGFASIMAGIVFFGGIQLFVLGVFGEYLSRVNFKTSKKPLFLIGRDTDDDIFGGKDE